MTDAPERELQNGIEPTPQPWQTLERRKIYQQEHWLTVESHTVQLPDGQRIENWSWLILPTYVNVAAITEFGRFLCFRQTKYAVEGVSLAPVGGYIEPNEEPLAAAQRELLEETGYEANEWISLGQYAVDGNRGAGIGHLFLAKGAIRIKEIQSQDLETQELVILKQEEIEAALKAGAFKVMPWATVMALALLHLNPNHQDTEG
jgi:ADP-ribose pyrophosphatase